MVKIQSLVQEEMLFKDCERMDRRTTTTDGEWSQYLTLSLRLRWANNTNLPYMKQEAHGPQRAHLSETATADM